MRKTLNVVKRASECVENFLCAYDVGCEYFTSCLETAAGRDWILSSLSGFYSASIASPVSLSSASLVSLLSRDEPPSVRHLMRILWLPSLLPQLRDSVIHKVCVMISTSTSWFVIVGLPPLL
jgi:hypothetical protein